MNTQLRQRDFSLFTLHFSLFTPKKSPRVGRVTGEYSQDTIKNTEKQSNSLFFCIFVCRNCIHQKAQKKKEISIGNFLLIFRASCRIRTNDPEITNHVLWPTELKRRVGSYLHRAATTNYLCYVPVLEDSKGAGRVRLPMLLTCESKPFKG